MYEEIDTYTDNNPEYHCAEITFSEKVEALNYVVKKLLKIIQVHDFCVHSLTIESNM